MAKTNPTTIHLAGQFRAEEGVAAAAVRPGDLVELTSADKVQKHSSSGGNAERAFAQEDALQGNDIDDNYALGDIVQYRIYEAGARVYAWLSGGENASIGSKLSSNGDGALKVESSTGKVVAVALEAIDASDSNDVDERIRVRIV